MWQRAKNQARRQARSERERDLSIELVLIDAWSRYLFLLFGDDLHTKQAIVRCREQRSQYLWSTGC